MKSNTFLILITCISIFFNSCNKKPALFLNDINFDDGEYSLIINHKTKGKFWIDNEQVLKKYKNIIKIKGSFINYLPGEGNRDYGLILLKNKEVYKVKHGAVFNVFEIGDILDFAEPFEDVFKKVSEYKTKEEFKEYDFQKIENNRDIYMLSLPKFNPNNFEYRFNIKLPSLAVPVHYKNKDTDPYWRSRPILPKEFNEYKIRDSLFQKITNDLSNFKNYTLGKSIIIGSITGLNVMNNKTHEYLKTKNNKTLTVTDFQIQLLELSFECSKDFYDEIKNYNFDKYIIDSEFYNKKELYNSILNVVNDDKKIYSEDDLFVDGYKIISETSSLYEMKYELSYFQKIKPFKDEK